ncbi:endocuticle structural glycoprotein ABD-4-like [Nilaparvata lugens]|uniref:Cuticular protein n=1 Tax=Nilaparvata lugens TaxID=108931 RepID=A0A2S1ZS54_NILLU|nr:endocuticle structural glycoprotein ABD-4-like [Nilaparvata lugens]AWK28298.1 cuticular protein [Nilaparvata lugens]
MSMLTFVTLSAVLVALTSAQAQVPFNHFQAPQSIRSANHIPVVSRTEDRHDDGAFNFKYLTGDGQSVQESGVTKRNHENDGNVIVKSGSYQFTSPEGITYQVTYTADEYGFHPVASHLPQPVVAPPVTF